MNPARSTIAAPLAAVVVLLTAAVLVSVTAAPSFGAGSKVRVRIVGANNGKDVTDGGVAGRGHFTARGAITAKGKVVAYRTVTGPSAGGAMKIKLRFVATSAKGTITFVVKIDTGTGSSRWKITSATKHYKGLHGAGTETENADHTVSVLTGTVGR